MITRVELYVSPRLSESWSNLTSYDGYSLSYVAGTTDGLVAYQKYRFKVRAINSHGASDYSLELVAAVAPLPGQFAAISKLQSLSSNTSIMVSWAVPVSEVEPILGFKLRMIVDATNATSVIFD